MRGEDGGVTTTVASRPPRPSPVREETSTASYRRVDRTVHVCYFAFRCPKSRLFRHPAGWRAHQSHLIDGVTTGKNVRWVTISCQWHRFSVSVGPIAPFRAPRGRPACHEPAVFPVSRGAMRADSVDDRSARPGVRATKARAASAATTRCAGTVPAPNRRESGGGPPRGRSAVLPPSSRIPRRTSSRSTPWATPRRLAR